MSLTAKVAVAPRGSLSLDGISRIVEAFRAEPLARGRFRF